MEIEIAGVVCSVIAGDERMVLSEFPAEYRPFLKKSRSSVGAADLEIRLQRNDLPDTSAMTKIFDTAQSWSMFRDEKDYVVALTAPLPERRFVWVARIDEGFRKACVFCSDMLIREEGDVLLVSNPVLYPLDQILFIYMLSLTGGALFHASGVRIGSGGYIFPGRSGAGKSTISRQFTSLGISGLLSDDRIAARKMYGEFRVFGTPWAGEARIASNGSLPLGGIFFLRHGNANTIRDLKQAEAFESLMSVTSVPWYDKEPMTRVLSFCEDLVCHVPAYELHFKPDGDVINFLEDFIAKRD